MLTGMSTKGIKKETSSSRWHRIIARVACYGSDLFYRSNYVPRAISLFSLLAVLPGLADVVFLLAGYAVPILVSLPILPFELAIGTWLLIRDTKMEQAQDVSPAGAY